ncbi:hypothetical protein ACFL29_01540, partial [Patescibacteria group bacterium]
MNSKIVFVFSCFCVFVFSACVHHELSPAEEFEPPPPQPKTIKEIVTDEIYELPEYKLSPNWIPLKEIWRNTNFESYNFQKFFDEICPKQNQHT